MGKIHSYCDVFLLALPFKSHFAGQDIIVYRPMNESIELDRMAVHINQHFQVRAFRICKWPLEVDLACK